MKRPFDAKVAVITGAGRGLGKAVALRLAQGGANLVLVSRTTKELDVTADESRRSHSNAVTIRADVSKERDVARVREIALDEFGIADILVNNAASIGPIGPTYKIRSDDWTQTILVNLVGTFLLTRAFLPDMISKRKGKIINIGGSGEGPLANFSAYAASKSAIIRFTETVAAEVRPFRIDVNVVAPGGTHTRMTEEIYSAGRSAGSSEMARVRRIRKDGGVPLSVPTELIAFLASRQSDGLTGKLISAVHDDWQRLERLDEISSSDLFTMRRVDYTSHSRLRFPRRGVRKAT